MSTPETKARAGQPVPGTQMAAADIKSAFSGFLGDFKSFQDDIKSKLQQTEERLTMLDRKSKIAGRPALETAQAAEAPHQKAFEAYVRSGDDDALRSLDLEGNALSTTVSGDGGYLVDPGPSDTSRS